MGPRSGTPAPLAPLAATGQGGAVRWNVLRSWKCSRSVLYHMVGTRHMCLWSPQNEAGATEEPDF